MNPGLLILVLAVVVAVGFGLHRRRTDGSFAGTAPVVETSPVVEAGPVAETSPVVEVRAPASLETTAWDAITAALPAAAAGEHATLVQFSSAFCAPCRTTRVVLSDVADAHDGVAHLEIDAEEHLDLVRALDVRRTPTTLILDATGLELARAAGAPRREQVLAALPSLAGASGESA